MKNMRKIVAILAAALMLFSVLPMSAFAADGDVVWSIDFNDGETKFSNSEVATGPDGSVCMKWTATGAWSSTYVSIRGFEANTDYTATFKAKASVAGGMGITIEDGNWGNYTNVPGFDVTTEWAEYVVTFNSASHPNENGAILFKFQDEGVAMDLYVDDLVISEGLPKKPLCENGDFESGDEGWLLSQGSAVDATAAYTGNAGAHLISGANWNSMLERTFDVVAGKNYELSYWVKAVSGGANIKYLDQNWQGAAVASGAWFSTTEWTQITVTFTAISDKFYFQFCGAGNMASELYVDDVVLWEIKEPSFDGYIYNGDLETGKLDHWTNLYNWSTVELVEGLNGDYALKGVSGGAWNIVYQEVAVTPNTNYTVWAYAKDATDSALWIKNAGGIGDITSKSFTTGSDWSKNTISFNSGSNNSVWVGMMGLSAGATYTVDDVFMFEVKEASDDGYLVNGTFETGDLAPWDNLWGSCPKAEVVRGGKDDNFSVDIVSGEWKHVRQTPIAVEANTDYKISLWAKNVTNMNLLVKDSGDNVNLANKGISGGDEWTYNEFTFNSGDYTSVIVSLMGGATEAYGSFDNVVMEKVAPACEHEYDNACDVDCNLCYEAREVSHNVVHAEAVEATCAAGGNIEHWYCDVCGMAWLDEAQTQNTNLKAVKLPAAHTFDYECSTVCSVCYEEVREASHSLTYVEAVEAVDCQTPGHIAYYQCEYCSEMYADANGIEVLNPWFISITVDCTRPEDAADCAIVPCEVCGNDTYGYGEHDVVACQGGVCGKCGDTIEGYGCANYDTPACEDGVCYYCGGFVAGYGHENGAWADCLDGECAYGCGLQYPATADHVDAEGDDYCDNCWGHLAHVDEDANGECDICWTTMPHDCIDEDGDGWCDICWSEMPVVEVIYGDANGDGEVTLLDAVALQQYLSGYDVTLGPATV